MRQKIWAVIWGGAIFLLFLFCSVDLDILCRGSFYHHLKCNSWTFMHKISTRVGYVNGKHPELVRLERDAWRSMLTVRFTCALARTARPKSQHYISKLSWKKYRLYFYCCISEVSKTLAQIFIVKCIVRHTWLVNFVARLSCRAHVTLSSVVGHKQHSRTITAEIYHSGRIYWTII